MLRTLVALLGLSVVVLTACGPAQPGPAWGVYAGPGPTGAAGAISYADGTGVRVRYVLDFLPDDSWDKLTSARWLIDAYRDTDYQLVLSLPMLPRNSPSTLAACANGAYAAKYRTIAQQLVAAKLDRTIIRPGWEGNGDWYPWSAGGQPDSYIGCYRQVVATMRAVAPRLRFDWSVNVGANATDGATLYPGDDVVDVIGVDAYDYSWRWYPAPSGLSEDEARRRAAAELLNGSRGLRFWAGFAAGRRKPLALSEWGMAWRSDGHAGADNPHFAAAVLAFVADPANRVSYAIYFNATDTPEVAHNITSPQTRFPRAAQQIFAAGRS